MFAHRTISWNAALRNLHSDRRQFAPGERAALVRREGFVKLVADRARRAQIERPFVVDGRYDRSSIMRAAVAAAQARREVTGDAWGVCLSAALKGVWQVAKAAKAARAAMH